MKNIRKFYYVTIVIILFVASFIFNKSSSGEITKVSVSRDFKTQDNGSQVIDDEAIAMSGTIQTSEVYEMAAKEAFDIVNAQRKAAGLAELVWNEDLKRAASVRAGELEKSFSHTRPDGSEWWTVNSTIMYGENLAKNFSDAKSAMDAWNASPTHKSNIMDSSYKTLGIAVVCGTNGEWLWAQEFGY